MTPTYPELTEELRERALEHGVTVTRGGDAAVTGAHAGPEPGSPGAVLAATRAGAKARSRDVDELLLAIKDGRRATRFESPLE